MVLDMAVLGENTTSIHPAKRPAAPAVNDGTDSCVSKQPSEQSSFILYGLISGFTWVEGGRQQPTEHKKIV